MGALNDILFADPEAWNDRDALLRFVEALPDGVGDIPARPGVQGRVRYSLKWCAAAQGAESDREAVRAALEAAGRDVEAGLALYDRPAELRRRMSALIRRFYDDVYASEWRRRLPCLERSVAAHRGRPVDDVERLMRDLTGRQISCLSDAPDRYERFIFAPSPDMGPYVSCADMPPIHGLYYPCPPPDAGEADLEVDRLAQVWRALGDAQRLRILRLLRGRELYAQEIAERTGLHQSVVSRHLSYLKAVGLVRARRAGAMKYFTVDPAARDRLAAALELFSPEE